MITPQYRRYQVNITSGPYRAQSFAVRAIGPMDAAQCAAIRLLGVQGINMEAVQERKDDNTHWVVKKNTAKTRRTMFHAQVLKHHCYTGCSCRCSLIGGRSANE